jgi:siroheme decarboxylase
LVLGLRFRKWRVASGEWRVASGEWRVASGEWRVASGEWRVASGEWRVASGEWRVASGEWRVASGEWRVASGEWHEMTSRQAESSAARFDSRAVTIDEVDRRLIVATQEGLPRCERPYHAIAERLGIAPEEVVARLARMLDAGVIRRIGAVPNHYRLGYTANGMSVWDVPETRIHELGPKVGALDFVSHCYHRPRHPPDWPYNLFAMVHGRDRAEVERQVGVIAGLLGAADRGHAILYSTRILKKTGLRIG